MPLLLLCLIPYFFKCLFCNYDISKIRLYSISFYSKKFLSISNPVLVLHFHILVCLFVNPLLVFLVVLILLLCFLLLLLLVTLISLHLPHLHSNFLLNTQQNL